jgi:exosortase E/protease (VPEID-CTERM system)
MISHAASRPLWAWLVALAVFATEFAIFGAMSSGHYPEVRGESNLLLVAAGQTPTLVRAAGGLVLTFVAYFATQSAISAHGPASLFRPSRTAMVAHLAGGIALLTLLLCIELNIPDQVGGRHALIGLSSLAWALLIGSAGATILPNLKLALGRLGVVIVAIFFGALIFAQYEESLSEILISGALLPVALFFASLALEVVGLVPYQGQEPTTGLPVLGAGNFQVTIWPTCAGYEGVAITFLILAAYMVWQRNRLRVTRVLCLFPVVAMILFAFNVLRLTALIYIGSRWSPTIAQQGFHTYIGWIYVISVTVIAVFSLETSRFFQIRSVIHVPAFSFRRLVEDRAFLLSPFIVFTMCSLISGAFTGSFAWFYPGEILIVSAFVLAFRSRLLRRVELSNPTAILVGLALSILWIALVPEDSAKSLQFGQELFSASTLVSLLWLLCRIAGSVAVTPIVEELAFRGFVQPQLAEILSATALNKFGPAVAIVVTSTLFGLLHNEILPAVLAGVAYGWLKYRYGSIWPSIVAHSVTNAVIATYAVIFSAWSYL